MMMYKIGDRGPKVARLQAMLNQQRTTQPKLNEDGLFGPRTEDAVQCFQSLRHESPNGVVMDSTWKALKHAARRKIALGDAYWLRIARMELGVRQDSRAGRQVPRVQAYHRLTRLRSRDDATPWSSSFVNWVLQQANYRGTGDATPESWLGWGMKVPRAVRGAIAVIRRKGAKSPGGIMGSEAGYHVGFLLQKTATQIRLLGGDQQECVCERSFDLSEYEVVGYRWPKPKRHGPSTIH